MKVFIFLTSLILSFFKANTQIYHVYEDIGQNSANSVLPTNNGYILMVGNTCDSVCNSIYKISEDGNIVYKKEFNGFNGKLFKTTNPDLEYIICGFCLVTDRYQLVLKEIDSEGNTRKTLRFSDTNSSIYGYQVIDDGQGYIFNATKSSVDRAFDSVYIFKTDYNGNLLWKNVLNFEANATYFAIGLTNITQFSKGEYAVVGKYVYKDSQSIFANEKSFLVRFNGDGIISYADYFPELREHLRTFKNDPFKGTNMYHFACEGFHDSYLVSALIDTVITIPGKDWAYKHALLIELDINNQPLKYTILANYLDAQVPLGIIKCKNGDIIYMDYGGDPIFYPNCDPGFRINRVSPRGEIEWQRTYVSPYYFYPDSSVNGLFNFVEMAELDNGSIIVIGSYDNYKPQIGDFDQDAFVMILDSFGCFNSSCQMYTNVFQLSTVSTESKSKRNIQTYPNPTNDLLNIKIISEPNIYLNLELYDWNGNKILAEKRYLNDEATSLDISHLNEGIYTLKLYEGKRMILTSRFIKFNNK